MKITTPEQLSLALQETRLFQDLSQAKLGDMIGLRQGTVSNFENQPDSTKLGTLFKILAALELQIEITPRHSEVKFPHPTSNTWNQEW